MKSPRIWLMFALIALVSAGIGVIVGDAGDGDDGATAGRLDELDAAIERLQAERDRLRDERDQLEARLAAEDPPAVCPDEYVSTGNLVPWFTADHPCGWHVLFDPRAMGSSEDQPGLRAEILVFSRLPISIAPREGPLGDYELADWSDEPGGDDALAPVGDWVAEERARFEVVSRNERFEAGDGITIHRLIGRQRLFDEPVEVHVLFWEYEDAVSGARHVVRAFAMEPGARTIESLERLARSFRVRR